MGKLKFISPGDGLTFTRRQKSSYEKIQLGRYQEEEEKLLNSGHPLHPHQCDGQQGYQGDGSYQPDILQNTADSTQQSVNYVKPTRFSSPMTPLKSFTCSTSKLLKLPQKPMMYMETPIEFATVNISPIAPPNSGPRLREIM